MFIGCIIALAVLAWLPAKDLTRTMLGGHAEHFIAYLGTAIILGLTFRKSPSLAVQCVVLIVYAAVLEGGTALFAWSSRLLSRLGIQFCRRSNWWLDFVEGAPPRGELAEN